jgi:biopolymer transport protein ExbB
MSETIAFLMKGGGAMIPLGICSVLGLSIILERLVSLRRTRSIPHSIVNALSQVYDTESLEQAALACSTKVSPLERIVSVLVRSRHLEHEQLIELLHSNGRKEVEKLERGLLVLEVIAGIAPLIGLLGTVLGMVTVFDAITAHGLGDAQVLSDGISKALITTVAGLSIGIPALAFHSYFSKKVDSIAIEMQELSVDFMTHLIHLEKR